MPADREPKKKRPCASVMIEGSGASKPFPSMSRVTRARRGGPPAAAGRPGGGGRGRDGGTLAGVADAVGVGAEVDLTGRAGRRVAGAEDERRAFPRRQR